MEVRICLNKMLQVQQHVLGGDSAHLPCGLAVEFLEFVQRLGCNCPGLATPHPYPNLNRARAGGYV